MTAPLCRFCRTPLVHTFLDLGRQPLANSYLTAEQLAAGTEAAYPLHVRVCHQCFLVQADDAVPADAIFDESYAYFSSYSTSWVEHARRYAADMTERFGLGPESLVVEVASNDGYLLQHFVAMDIPVLGVEPTANTAQAAIARGVPTEVMFFGAAAGRALAARCGQADLMAANNVLAHVPDIGDFVAGFREVLKDEGVLTFEFPHLLNLIEKVQFDTIYHEHFSYLSLLAVEQVLRANGLRPFDIERLSTHGGSLRVFCCHMGSGHEETEALRRKRGRPQPDRDLRRFRAAGRSGARQLPRLPRGGEGGGPPDRGLWGGGQGQHLPQLLWDDHGRYHRGVRREPRETGPLPARQPPADPRTRRRPRGAAGRSADPALEPQGRDHGPDGLHPRLGRPLRHGVAKDHGHWVTKVLF
jgi:SAM-dependent methyltransferase